MRKFIEKIKAALNNESGFTMIELIIVIALIAIIGAMLVPSFTQTTARSRIKTDINGIKTVQNAVNLYAAEAGTKIASGMEADLTSSHPLIANAYLELPRVQAGGVYHIDEDPTGVYTVQLVLTTALTGNMLQYVQGLEGVTVTGGNTITVD